MTNGLQSAADLDETDLTILERIEANFDVSLETLAIELDTLRSTVHYRISKLKESGVTRGITADVDPRSLGLEMVAITDVFVTRETGYPDEIDTELGAPVDVEQVYYTMGDIDFVVISRVQSRERLNAFIDRVVAIDGANETPSKFVIQEFKNDRRYVSNLSEETRAAVTSPSNDADGWRPASRCWRPPSRKDTTVAGRPTTSADRTTVSEDDFDV